MKPARPSHTMLCSEGGLREKTKLETIMLCARSPTKSGRRRPRAKWVVSTPGKSRFCRPSCELDNTATRIDPHRQAKWSVSFFVLWSDLPAQSELPRRQLSATQRSLTMRVKWSKRELHANRIVIGRGDPVALSDIALTVARMLIKHPCGSHAV